MIVAQVIRTGRWIWVSACMMGPMVGYAQDIAYESRAGTRTAEIGGTLHAAQSISIKFSNTPLDSALEAVARLAKLDLSYRRELVANAKPVTAEFVKQDVMVIFRLLLDPHKLRINVTESGHAVVVREVQSQAVSSISGRVLDSITGQGVSGATVSIIGTQISAVTTNKGEFVITDVPVGEQQVNVKLFGYRAVTRTVSVAEGKRAALHVILAPVTTILSEMVTTATGPQRRLEIANSIAVLNVDSLLAVAPIKSVTDLLEARVPGLDVLRTTGTPGDPSRIRLRGASSILGSNAPIVIVDGVRIHSPDGSVNKAARRARFGTSRGSITGAGYPAPSPLDQIDPNSIAKIEVIKGPSATALYGSDAANGVIVITKKRGVAGDTRVSLSLNGGTSSFPGSYPVNYFIFGHGFNRPTQQCNFDSECIVDSIVAFQALNDSRYSPLDRGHNAAVSGTVSGGVQNLRYSFTGSASTRQGMMQLPFLVVADYREKIGTSPPAWMRNPDSYRTLNGSGTLDMDISPTMQVKFTTEVGSSDQQRSSLGLTAAPQLMQIYVDPATFRVSPLLRGYQERVNANFLKFQNSLNFQWQVRPNVPITLTAGFNPDFVTQKTYLPPQLPTLLGTGSDTGGSYSISRGNTAMTSLSGRMTLPIRLVNGSAIRLSIGADVNRLETAEQTITTSYVPEGITDPQEFLPAYTNSLQSTSGISTYGWYVDPQLDLGSRLFLQPSLRLDGGSSSGANAGLTGFPKIGLSWIAFDHSDSRRTSGMWYNWMSLLKLWVSGGQAGVQPGPTQRLRLFTLTSTTLDGGATGSSAYKFLTVGNTELRPERSTEITGGFNTVLLGQRISLEVSTYYKKQRDAILAVSLAPSLGAGVQSHYVNIGTIQNRGVEITMDLRAVQTPLLQWDMNFGLSRRSNKVVSLAPGASSYAGFDQSRIVVGYPLFGKWARPILGYADRNGDGKLERSEIALGDSAVYMGANEPRFTGLYSTTLGFFNGRLSTTASFSYTDGFTQYNANGKAALRSAANNPHATFAEQAAAIISGSVNDISKYYLIQTVNTLRFQSLSMNYTAPASIAKFFRSRNVTIALQGQNLGLHTNYRGKDPNVNAFSQGNSVADFGQLPQPREWSLRVSLLK